MKLTKYLMSLSLAAAGVATFSSCEDMLDKGNSYVVYADTQHLTSSSDTVTSVVGIMNKLQAIAVRSNLLGEVRADLVDVNENGTIDLKNLASFNADVTSKDDENRYNVPRDYYAVINNCNYFLKYVNDSLPEIHTDEMKTMFEREIAQVRTMRAWTYLQCVLAYGKVPFVVEPVLSEADSKKTYTQYGIEEICDYFINDLKPYVNVSLPLYNKFGDSYNTKPQLCMFYTNLVLADLYLWKAACSHDSEMAKLAAKSYYDFIEWRIAGKKRTTTGYDYASYSVRDYLDDGVISGAGTIDFDANKAISIIAMDSSAAKGYFNELRDLYCYSERPDLKPASINPSEAYKELSRSQSVVGYDSQRDDTVEVTRDILDEELLEDGYEGDLRFASMWQTRDRLYNEEEVKLQTIKKHRGQNVIVYTPTQVYLRLAEALNYAGYPRFAKQILVMGLSNSVIDAEVRPYYTSSADSAFINYFDFNDTYYMPYYASYSTSYDDYGIPVKFVPSRNSQTSDLNMIGIHSRGSAYSFMNKNYLPELDVLAYNGGDSIASGYPFGARDTIGVAPVKSDYTATFPSVPTKPKTVKEPTTWALFPDSVLSKEDYAKINSGLSSVKLDAAYKNYVDKDSVGKYSTYLQAMEQFDADVLTWQNDTATIMAPYWAELSARSNRIAIYKAEWQKWHDKVYAQPTFIQAEQDQLDKAILDEQALELVYEGNRYYDLMRRALWYGDAKYMDEPISAARPELAGKLLNKKNWFLHYKGQIGY